MKNIKTTEIIALVIVGVLIVATIIGGGWFIANNVKEANKKLESTGIEKVEDGTFPSAESTSQQEGEEVTVADKTTSEDDKKSGKKETESVADNSTKTENKTNKNNKNKTDKKTNSKKDKYEKNDKPVVATEKATQKTDSDAVQEIVPETNATHSSKKVLKVNGVDCYVGDTITVALNIETPEVLMNFQGYTKYDDQYLEFVGVEANVNGLFNDHESCIYYNGSDINKGFDFTEKGTMYTATFKVKKAGSTGIVNTIEVLTDLKDKVVNPKDAIITIGIYN